MIYDYETNTGGTRPKKENKIINWLKINWGLIIVYGLIIGLAFLFDKS